MTIAEQIQHLVAALPEPKQQEVLDFVSFLRLRASGRAYLAPVPPIRSVKGMWADLDIKITDEDIAQARREMWGNFPREID